MINKNKIALMSNLARYEKRFAENDKKVNDYFRYDYISRKNIVNVIFVTIFSTICVLIYQVNNIYNEELVFELEFLKKSMIDSIWFIVFFVVIYSFIGFFVYNREFNEKSKRVNNFYFNLEKLNKR